MCGIAGGFWRYAGDGLEARGVTALDRMTHRGPDDSGLELYRSTHGTVLLGQRRLSIIDLSSGGHQPAHTADGALSMVYNGELYNYRELRDELRACGRIFTTESDTEVLLAAWAQWGRACLPRLEGMFAFVVYDHRRQTLTCVRDAFGIKPLFIQADGDEFLFASEQPALAALRSKAARPDLQRAYDYLVHGDYDSGERSFIDGVHHLLPGALIEIDLGSGKISEPSIWWRAPVEQTERLSFSQAVEAAREQFLANIRLHLRSDVPVGAALSGGVDSSAVVCAMRHVEPKLDLHTFSYIAEGDALSEEKWVDFVNEKVGATAHKIRAGAADLARDVDALVRAQGEPFGSTSIYAQYLVFQRAKEAGITVTLDGQGADELLAGYDGYPGYRMLSLFEKGQPLAAHRFARASANWPGRSYRRNWMEFGRIVMPDGIYARSRKALGRDFRPDWLDIDMFQRAGVDFRERRAPLARANRGRRVVEQLGHSLQVRGIPHLLRHGDRNAMAFSIESRVPFLTIPMAELLLRLPENYLVSAQGESKRVFRAAMRDIVPDAILDRKDKIGFATPEQNWFRALAPDFRQVLAHADTIPMLKKGNLLRRFDDVIEGRSAFSWQAWRWINYIKWHQQEFG